MPYMDLVGIIQQNDPHAELETFFCSNSATVDHSGAFGSDNLTIELDGAMHSSEKMSQTIKLF